MKALPPLERAVSAAVAEQSDLSRGAAALHLAIQQFRDFEGHVVWSSPARSGGGRSGKGAFDPYRLLLDIGIADALEPVVETLTWSKPTSILQTVIRRTHAALGLRTTNHAVRESARDAINELEHWRRQSRLVRFSPRLRSGQVYCTGKSRGR